MGVTVHHLRPDPLGSRADPTTLEGRGPDEGTTAGGQELGPLQSVCLPFSLPFIPGSPTCLGPCVICLRWKRERARALITRWGAVQVLEPHGRKPLTRSKHRDAAGCIVFSKVASHSMDGARQGPRQPQTHPQVRCSERAAQFQSEGAQVCPCRWLSLTLRRERSGPDDR